MTVFARCKYCGDLMLERCRTLQAAADCKKRLAHAEAIGAQAQQNTDDAALVKLLFAWTQPPGRYVSYPAYVNITQHGETVAVTVRAIEHLENDGSAVGMTTVVNVPAHEFLLAPVSRQKRLDDKFPLAEPSPTTPAQAPSNVGGCHGQPCKVTYGEPPQAREELTPEIAEIEKRHAEGRAEANGYGDYTFSEWCIRNGKGAHNDRATLLAHIKARAPNDYFAFFQKHALGSLAAPSCLACGRAEPFSIRHGELPNIGLCDACTARTRAGESK